MRLELRAMARALFAEKGGRHRLAMREETKHGIEALIGRISSL